jgi:hypothetical protein
MRSRGLRLTILATLVLAGIAAGGVTWDMQRRIATLTFADEELHARLDRMISATGEIATAQQAYVVPGQADEPWMARVAALLQQLGDDIAAVATRTRSASAAATLQGITDAVTRLGQFDTQLREKLLLDEELIAADLIFSEGRAAADAAAAQMGGLRDAERAAYDSARGALLRRSWLTLGGAAGLWLLGLLLLVRVPAARVPAASPEREHVPVLDVQPVAQPEPEPAPAARPPLDLAGAADVCTSISRMTATDELPGLLARAATVLDASGLIIWMSAGDELFAVTAHGYDPRVIARLGPIGRTTDNATAASWRSGQLKVVPGDIISNGAVVAPMFGPDACIGVLAAQLAAVVAAWPAASTAPDAAPSTAATRA